ncbi:MAG: hypothetical protein RML38_04860 [Bacteroidia bacterium]|nr:hypothetical protein [Bacteroidia bacterium]
MKNKVYQKLPTYRPSDKVWQNIERRLDAANRQRKVYWGYVWLSAACFLVVAFASLFLVSKPIENKSSQEIKILYTEEDIDTHLYQRPVFESLPIEIEEIETLCQIQPVKCQDEYAQALIQQIKDLEKASFDLDQQTTSEQPLSDMSIEKHKSYLQKEKYKRIKKLKRYLNE